MTGPLSGIAVVEAGEGEAVRYCGRLFATLGANVVRIGDPAPTEDLFGRWLDEAKAPAASLDEALEACGDPRRLVLAGTDPGSIADVERRLAAMVEAPTLLALTWFDPRGSYAAWKANDPVIQALSGVAFGFGLPEGPPILPQGVAPQLVAGVTAFIAGLGALFEGTRPVRRVEVNVFEAALCFVETGAVASAASGVQARRLGVNRFSPTYPCSIYPAADGHVGVTALTFAQWRSLTELIGRPELALDPRFQQSWMRLQCADEIDAALAPVFATRPTDYWVKEGDRRRIPITPAPRPAELPGLPHWRQREAFRPIAGTGVAAPTAPFHFVFEGAPAPAPAGGASGPLTGVRVADFSMGWAGPLAARYLGDLGADVLKIESHSRPDWWRGWEVVESVDPPPTEVQRNFMAVNRSKRGLDLDLARSAGRRAAQEIIRRSDVVIENQGPGVMDRLGLGPADQRRLNPAVISISMPPFGRTGPLAGLRAYGSTVEQASGMPFVNGHADWDPCHQHVAYGDPVAGLYAAAAALVALHGRPSLGGAEIDLCQVECLFQLGAPAIIAEQASGRPLERTGSRRPDMAPCAVVRAAGGDEAWLAVAVDCDAAWRGLCQAIERPDLAADASLATLAGRKAREDELEAALGAWAASRSARAATQALQASGVPAAPVLGGHHLSSDAHLVATGYWAKQHRRYVGEHLTPSPPFRFDGARPPIGRPAPVLGEHTREVLQELGIEQIDGGAAAEAVRG